RSPRRRGAAPKLAAAAAALLIVATPIALVWHTPSARADDYRTDIGQKLDVTLEDGSRVTLDTASRVRLAYGARERRLILLAGQARFEVAKHEPRPFVVEAGGQRVIAHGTAFDVRLDPRETRVALIEGRVTVAGQGRAVAMRPGELLVSGARGVRLRRDPRAVEALTSWNEGLVIAEDQPLGAVVAEMNRYARRPIRVEGAAAAIRVSGAFRAGATESFAEALALGFPVRAARAADGAILLVPAPAKK
ncbi:MAG: FecR domain-containing protein, partial [Sphingomonas sp.]|nr:FecR domain-containing protein [Sphingomonas sp.]